MNGTSVRLGMPASDATSLARLTTIGFRRAGCWNCVDGALSVSLDPDIARAINFLYAFTISDEVKYVG